MFLSSTGVVSCHKRALLLCLNCRMISSDLKKKYSTALILKLNQNYTGESDLMLFTQIKTNKNTR